MSVNIIKGDMVESFKNKELLAYAHQANCFCTMKRGIAPQLTNVEPEVKWVDDYTEVGDKKKMGTFTRTQSKPYVYNIYGQYHWTKYPANTINGRNTDYPSLYKGLCLLKEDLLRYKGEVKNLTGEDITLTLGLPLIGCGLAGGAWEDVVLPMIYKIFEKSEIEVTIFKL